MLGAEDAQFYMQAISILRWIVELGRMDICGEVAMISLYSTAPRTGHLDAVLHIFSYLRTHERSRIVMDDTYLPYKEFEKPDWSHFLPGCKGCVAT